MAAERGTPLWSPGLATISLPKQHYLADYVIHQVKFSPINRQKMKKNPGYHRSVGRNLEHVCFPFPHICIGDTWQNKQKCGFPQKSAHFYAKLVPLCPASFCCS